jgi:hypothetical protein
MMGEFLLLKQLKGSSEPPCPDLAPLLDGVRVAYLPRRSTSDVLPAGANTAPTPRGDSPASRPSRSEPPPAAEKHGEAGSTERRPARLPKAVVVRPAHIRSHPSKSAEIVGIAQQGTSFEVYATKHDWVQVGNGSPEGWVAGFLVSR